MNASVVRRPTEHAALRAAARSARPLPPVDCLLEALVIARRAGDREGMTLAAHRAVRAAAPEVGAP
ncbi:hypothetical protein HLK59_10140 [Streptomyces sp. S3(2020)]|uniref:hypothetical protein n=1 Tax=Streptomyces sp. S3(2020) TaxID=2732044 RepID=UPI0014890BDD|nr:hypothetical protein [Streptomyces sp. S3(2020)]NNN30716.1 hypothetical protein [Streptomyces sp. S3(2020)]